MEKEFKVNQSSRWTYFYEILLITLSITFVATIGYGYYNNIDIRDMIKAGLLGSFLTWFIVFGFPLFLLYFNHTKHSKSVVFKRNNDSFRYENLTDLITFYREDIEKIELWLTPSAYNQRIDWQYFGKYHYLKIYTKAGSIINISCLVLDEPYQVFPDELITRRKNFFPLMKDNYLV
jgi:hypothetical protein